MLDEQDQGTRIGVTVALGVALLVAIGLSLWLAVRGGTPKAAAPMGKPAAAAAVTAPVPPNAELAFVDAPLAGEKIAALYFAVGDSALPADAASQIAAIKKAADTAPSRKLVLSGFHDATGDAARNAELAKNRAVAVRTALQGEGVAPERIVLRKPESTTGEGSHPEARRVEVRLAD